MRKILVVLPAFALTLISFAVTAQLSMFRGKPDHNYVIDSPEKLRFDRQLWKFDAGSPIRSSALANGNAVYFGTSSGQFYALNKNTGEVKWIYASGSAIASGAAVKNGTIYFTNNDQSLLALDATTGRLKWKKAFEKNRPYDWGFDYYFSSPTLVTSKILVGSADGHLYCVNDNDGKTNWKFKTEGIIRSSPAASDNRVFVGDSDGILYAVNLSDGRELWRFRIEGNAMRNDSFGFDRRAIISSPVVKGNKVIFGGRDGFLYAVDATTGKLLWKMDHKVSWVISTVAIRDSLVITGTSDGRFVQAVNLETGKEIWRYNTLSIVWSSPVIYNNTVYIGSDEGILYGLNLRTGQRSSLFQSDARILSSPSISDSLMFFGTDNGSLYALKGRKETDESSSRTKRLVYWQPGINIYFRFGTDIKIKDYLRQFKYEVSGEKELVDALADPDSAQHTVIVFASNYFPPAMVNGHQQSLLRKFLERGGRIVILGNNPMMYVTDPVTKEVMNANFLLSDSVISTSYRYKDVRAFQGFYPATPTSEGKKWGLIRPWVAPMGVDPSSVDLVLGIDEKGMASAWVKKYSTIKGSGFIQIWIDAEEPENPGSILHVAEYNE